MKEALKDMLKGTLIVPYDDSVIEELVEVCNSYIMEDDFSIEDFENLVQALLSNKQTGSLCKTLEVNYKDKTGNEIKLPKCTWIPLTAFMLFISIKNSELDNELKAIYSAIVMNYMVLQKGKFSNVPFKKYIIQLYGYFDVHIEEKNEIQESNDDGLLNRILADADFVENEGISNDDLQCIANNAAKYRMTQLMKSDKLRNINNLFNRTYNGLVIFFDKLPWLYLDFTIQDIVQALLPQKNNSTKKLKNILDDIRSMDNFTAPQYASNSSILLRLLDNDSEIEETSIIEQKFTPQEFCVYLYYELMLEKKLEEYNDGEGE